MIATLIYVGNLNVRTKLDVSRNYKNNATSKTF